MDIKEINTEYISKCLQSIVDNIKFNEMYIKSNFRHGFGGTTFINIGQDVLYPEYGDTESVNGELIRVCNKYGLNKEQIDYIKEIIVNVVIEVAKLSKYDEVLLQIELKNTEHGNVLFMMLDELLCDKYGFYTEITSSRRYTIGNLVIVHTKWK